MALIHIDDWPQPVEAGRHRILEAALDAGVPYPHGCGTGECGGCKSQLLDGEVAFDRYSPDALSEEERAAGWILACRARPVSDVRVKWLSKVVPPPMVKFEARAFSVDRVAPDVVALTLSLPKDQPFDFRPGQFAKLRFGKLPARSYSMASQPGQNQISFHIRVLPDGKVSQYAATQLRNGERVEVRGPFGEAYWQGREDGPMLLLAGGTGLAPILSILDAALSDGQPPAALTLYHGVRTEADLYAGEMLERRAREHGFRFVPVFSEAGAPGARTGHLHEAVAADFSTLQGHIVYVAGPPPMVEAVKALASERGVPADRVHADAFFAAEPEKRSLWERITAWGGLDTNWGRLD